jgi:hypothetical protein
MKIFNSLNFWYWIIMIVFSIVCLITDTYVNSVTFMLMAIVGLMEHITGAIGHKDKED